MVSKPVRASATSSPRHRSRDEERKAWFIPINGDVEAAYKRQSGSTWDVKKSSSAKVVRPCIDVRAGGCHASAARVNGARSLGYRDGRGASSSPPYRQQPHRLEGDLKKFI
jgi:hypothetical protein